MTVSSNGHGGDKGKDILHEPPDLDLVIFVEPTSSSNPHNHYLLAKLLGTKTFNFKAFMTLMKSLWASHRDLNITQVDKSLFLLTLTSGRDVHRILKGEPWSFDKRLILLKEVSGVEKLGAILISDCAFWVKICDIPMCLRTESGITALGSKIGSFVSFDGKGPVGYGSFIRIWVIIDTSKPLRQSTSSHGYKECPDFSHSDSDDTDTQLMYGPWLRTSPSKLLLQHVYSRRPPPKP
ncbi:hypothetical protein Tsubulata_001783 [Turnera subulata]|uniref:DUF4283 domain-containing protein n=1 Tax=Turnera subulata TaxID=218843 RepID=A0A9Q0J7K6_9ROSI|nr:hypothetical protein Tsubulata_001783 [Turnera subulata]